MSLFRNICFTLNNYTQDEYDFIVHGTWYRYMIIGKEIGDSGTPHLQGYAVLDKRYRLNALKKLVGDRVHLEARKGTHNQAREYCMKDNDFCEFGVEPEQGKRNDLKNACELVKKDGAQAVAELMPELYVKYHRGLKELELAIQPKYDHVSVRGIWIFGSPGTGKSHAARHFDPNAYIKAQNKWWDGYNGQQCVILEDLDTDVLGHYLKIWADKWSCTGETKGGTVNLRYKLFVVTSNYAPWDLFKDDVMCEAISRRFKVIEKKDRNELVDFLILQTFN